MYLGIRITFLCAYPNMISKVFIIINTVKSVLHKNEKENYSKNLFFFFYSAVFSIHLHQKLKKNKLQR